MSNPAYVRCPRCLKLNPISPVELGMEHTCVFCGAIIPRTSTDKAEKDLAESRKSYDAGPKPRLESKPINRNKRKPTF